MPKSQIPATPESATPVVVTFAASALLILVGAIFLYRNFQTLSDHQRWVEHTYQVQRTLDKVLIGLREGEANVRAYLLTGDRSYLEPVIDSQNMIRSNFDQAHGLTGDNPQQQKLLLEIQADITNRFQFLENLVGKFDRDGKVFQRDQNFLEGRRVSSRIQSAIDQMNKNEAALLVAREQRAEQSKAVFVILLVLSTFLSFTAVLFAFRQWLTNQKKNLKDRMLTLLEAAKKEHLAETARLAAGDQTVKALSEKVLPYLARSTGALAGSLYTLQDNSLKLMNTFGDMDASVIRDRIAIGEGLLGEAFRNKEFSIHRDLPPQYLQVASSLGRASTNEVAFVPLLFQGFGVGVIELGYVGHANEDKIDFLGEAGEVIGIGINAAISREQTQILLEKTQMQAEELEAQQEELRTNNEELEQQARALEVQHETLNSRNIELEEIRLDVERKASDLERTSRYKSEFLAKMSHELRTPLNSLLILSTLLIENKDSNLTQKQVGFASSIRSAGNDLLNLINDILDLSKIEAQKITLHRDKVRVGEFLNQMREMFAPQAEIANLELVVNLGSKAGDKEIFTDRQRLEQILKNFVSNALKFTPKGSITLSAELVGDRINFAVEDTGIGIPANKRDLIFEAFEQVDNSLSRSFSGTGLGLTISRELAHLLGGSVSVTSEENKGTRFTLILPQDASGEAAETEVQPAPALSARMRDSGKSTPAREVTEPGKFDAVVSEALREIKPDEKTILIVEDDERFRKSVVEAVGAYHFKAIEAADGEVALAILERHIPTAVLLDIKLPGISGLGLLEMMKRSAHLRHVPIHMISALEHQQSAMRIGAMGYLTKPVTIDKVRSALTRIENMISQQVKKLLVIEDDERQQSAIQHLFEGSDIELIAAQSGAQALDIIQSQPIDCIILDLALPDISGTDFLESLTKLQVSIPPIVVYTGRDLSKDDIKKLQRFSDSIIIKGVKSPDRLLDEVNLFLHRVESLLPESKREMLAQLRVQSHQFNGSKVLVVDDDLRNVFALTSALEEKGFEIDVARNGVEAVEKVEDPKAKYDVVLMDIMMPQMDGLEATRKIRENPKNKNLPIIALTAKAMKGDHEKCIAAGCSDYLPKPVNLNNLFSVLKVWVQTRNFDAY